MKIRRYKKAQRQLVFLRFHYQFVRPYHVLVDGTFCKAALDNKINIREQVTKLFDADVRLYTTPCVVQELQLLGRDFGGALFIARQYEPVPCGHDWSRRPTPASRCIRQLVGDRNEAKYFVASQDTELQQQLRNEVAACPLLFVAFRTIIFDRISDYARQLADEVDESKISRPDETKRLKREIAAKIGAADANAAARPFRKRRKAKGPNPLSCKKKKKKPNHPVSRKKKIEKVKQVSSA